MRMKEDEQSDRFEDLSDLLDNAAAKLHPRSVFHKSDGRDQRIVRVFPYFVVICIIIWACGLVYLGDFSFSKILEILCLVFVSCFAILGVPCFLVMDRGVFSSWVLLAGTVVLTLILWVSGLFIGQVYYAVAVDNILYAIGIDLNDGPLLVVQFLATMAILFFTSVGVLSVINAYMRLYMSRTFLAMQSRAGTGRRGKAERFFMVPDIVDVQEVRMEPISNDHVFDLRTTGQVTIYTFTMGLLISSYVFLNPLLTDILTWNTMLAVMLMLSMFTPALVIPWIVVRGVGAKVVSAAPRDYYLWTGARNRLFSTFAALGVFMLMLVLSLYLGRDLVQIVMSYVSFLIPLFVTSVIYGTVYGNNFYAGTCGTIIERFENGK